MTEFTFHPASEWFPLMGAPELRELAEDIRINGLQNPIALLKGDVLDGRNRLAACKMANARIRTIDLPDDTDPVAYVVSHNVMRRHLLTSQRALIAARMANAKQGGRKLGHQISAPEAAQIMRVSLRSVETAKAFLATADKELIQMVERGNVSVSAANGLAGMDGKRQREIAELGPSAVVAEAHRKRGVNLRGRAEYANIWEQVNVLIDALEAGDLPAAHSASRKITRVINVTLEARKEIA